jgi:ADP-ribose pyrophosphatase
MKKEEQEKNPWKTLDAEVMYESKWIKVTKSNVLNPAGNAAVYSWVHFKNLAIGIFPLDEEKNTWLVGQYRYPLEAYSWEIPEGGGPLGTDPLESAKRELLEETGIEAKNFNELMRMHLSNSVSDELSITYLATGLSFSKPQPEESEVLQIKKLSLDEAFQWVLSGKITDSISVATILRVKWMDDKGELDQLLNIQR